MVGVSTDYSTHFLVILTVLFGWLALFKLRRASLKTPRPYLNHFHHKLLAEVLAALLTVAFFVYLRAFVPAETPPPAIFWFLYFMLGLMLFTATVYYQVLASYDLLARPTPRYLHNLFASAVAIGVLVIGAEFVRGPVRQETIPIRVFFFTLSGASHALLLWLSWELIREGRRMMASGEGRALAAVGFLLAALSLLWVLTVILSITNLMPVRLYQAINLSRTILLSVAVVFYLERFLENIERSETHETSATGKGLPADFLVRYKITEREVAVLELARQGRTNHEIGEQLFIAVPTVKSHLHNVFQKTRVKNRVQLVNLIQRFEHASEAQQNESP